VTSLTRESRCDRTRAWAALAPDGELAVLERRLLDAHLAHCAACRFFAEDVAAIAAELRAAAAERSRRGLVVPVAPPRRTVGAHFRAVASVAAVAAMAFGIAARTPFVDDAKRPRKTPRAARVDVAEAELRVLRLLRREAFLSGIAPPGRRSGTFGNRPA
jgi:putative zinc finger protein